MPRIDAVSIHCDNNTVAIKFLEKTSKFRFIQIFKIIKTLKRGEMQKKGYKNVDVH